LSLFTLLIWVPATLATPKVRMPWTALLISWAITAGAWVVAQNIVRKESAEPNVAHTTDAIVAKA
jgi:hypothetical protein